MTEPPPLIDIHCHLLPELDDGAASWDVAVAMARLAAADGLTTIIATTHQLGAFGRNHGDALRVQTDRLQQRLDREGVALRVLPGAEARIEPGLVAKLKTGDVLTLADRRRHVLLELPHEVVVPLDRLLADLKAAGMTGILAHPERNLGILGRPDLVPSLVRAGCLMQVTARSLLGGFGSQVQQFAQGLLQQGLVHFVATDAHGLGERRPLLAKGFQCVARLAGMDAALDLCCRNPDCVISGRAVVPSSQPRPQPRARGWLPWRKAG